MSAKIIKVSKDNTTSNCFDKIQSAIDFAKTLEGDILIEIEPGVYKEKLTVDRSNLSLIGCGKSPEDCILTFDDFAFDEMEDGSKRGTFRSYSVFIDANNISLKNLTVENSSGDSKTHGQAIALYADGDNLLVENCRLLGHQDTLFTGPLPPKELQPNGFIGPKQFAPRINGRQHYKNCYICGDVDFIFGSATAYFEACTIESLFRDDSSPIQGYITAASTPQNQEYGYIFENCDLVSKDCPEQSVYLGRPWRNFAKTIYLNCRFGKHIHSDGFHDWNKIDAHKTIFYGEYNNLRCNTPFKSNAKFVTELSSNDVNMYSIKEVLK